MDTSMKAKLDGIDVTVHLVSDSKLFAIVSYTSVKELMFKVDIKDLTDHSAQLTAELKRERG